MGGTTLAGNRDNRSRFEMDFSPDRVSVNEFRFTSFRSDVIGLLTGNCRVGDTVWGELLPFDLFSMDTTASVDAGLELLSPNNGGPTATHRPGSDSPVIDSARFGTSSSFFNCPTTGQRR
jgi:hypothetical protein